MKMKNIVYVIFCSIFYMVFFSPRVAYGNELTNDTNILNYINEFRSASEVPPLQINSKLQDAAQNHNQYMMENKVFSHQQEKTKRYFKGIYPLDRAAFFGYEYPFVIEFIQNNSATYTEAIDHLINNPYSRLSLLNPNYIHIGMNGHKGIYTFELGGKKPEKEYTVIYPAENQIKVPVKWNNLYEIDPFRKTNENRITSGYPITFSYFSNKDITGFKVNTSKVLLINQKTQLSVPIVINTPDNDEYLMQSLLIMPLTYLEKNTNYEVKVEVNITFKDNSTKRINRTWSFSTSEDEQFNQVTDLKGHWGKEQIEYLLSQDIASPRQDQLFMPNAYITRQEFIKMAIKAMNIDLQDMEKSIFRDIDINSEYADYIYTAYKNHIINGYSRTTFKPEDVITREQIVTILMRMYNQVSNKNYKNIAVSLSKSFKDIENASSWARSAVLAAKELNLVEGKEEEQFYPKEKTTRAEAAMLIYRFIKYMETEIVE